MAAGRAITWDGHPSWAAGGCRCRKRHGARVLGRAGAADSANACAATTASGNPWREIVGVSGNERDDGRSAGDGDRVLAAGERELSAEHVFLYRAIVAGGYAAVHARNPAGGLVDLSRTCRWRVCRPSTKILAQSLAQTSFVMVMLAIAAGVALLLGVVGIYGVITYMAAQRPRDRHPDGGGRAVVRRACLVPAARYCGSPRSASPSASRCRSC